MFIDAMHNSNRQYNNDNNNIGVLLRAYLQSRTETIFAIRMLDIFMHAQTLCRLLGVLTLSSNIRIRTSNA